MPKDPQTFTDIVNERSTGKYTVTLQDEAGTNIPSGSITSLTLTLFSVEGGGIVNARDGQNVLNQNNVTVDGNGLLTYNIQADDGMILDETLTYETHRAAFVCLFNGGAGRITWDVDFVYRNIQKVTT